MPGQPSAAEMAEAVRNYLTERVIPQLKGHDAFHGRVAANVLGILQRELELGPEADDEARERLTTLLGAEGTLDELNRMLCKKIRAGEMSLSTPGLLEHLRKTTERQLAIDQPNYSGLGED